MSQDYTSWTVGMKVVCVDDSPGRITGDGHLHSGYVYEIIGFDIEQKPLGIYLAGVPKRIVSRWKMPVGWNVSRFRPVQTHKTDISIFERILTNPHIRVEEDA